MAKIEIYTTPYCPYCLSAKALLTRKGVSFTEINVSGDSEGRRKMIERSGGYTVPQIFIDGTAIGGSDELHMLDREGKLDPLLARGGDAQLAASPETQA
jgi:glutaredoxin 3